MSNKLHELQNVVTMKACDVLFPDVSSLPGEQKSSGYTQSTLLVHHYQLVTNFRCFTNWLVANVDVAFYENNRWHSTSWTYCLRLARVIYM